VLDCAIRELIEETGYRASEWAAAGLLNNAIAYSNEAIEVWFARGLVAGERQLDAGEFLDICRRQRRGARSARAPRRADRCEDADRAALVAELARGRWAIEWRPSP
jgi:ADP-ribose pyrophosphatase